eukprot:jgi/Botrbrau1/13749/Bobra.0056s0006.1
MQLSSGRPLPRVAEANAHAAAVQKQMDTLRAQALAERVSLQDQVHSVTAALRQEKNERARIVMSLKGHHREPQGFRQPGSQIEGRPLQDAGQCCCSTRRQGEGWEMKALQRRGDLKNSHAQIMVLKKALSDAEAEARQGLRSQSPPCSKTSRGAMSRGACALLFDAPRVCSMIPCRFTSVICGPMIIYVSLFIFLTSWHLFLRSLKSIIWVVAFRFPVLLSSAFIRSYCYNTGVTFQLEVVGPSQQLSQSTRPVMARTAGAGARSWL